MASATLSPPPAGSAAPAAHKDSHKSGGSDAFAATDLLEGLSKRLRESGGADLLLGAIADGDVIARSGTSALGVRRGFVPLSAQFNSGASSLSFSVPANTLTADGEILLLFAWGDTGGAQNVFVNFAGTDIFGNGSTFTPTSDFFVAAIVARTGASSQRNGACGVGTGISSRAEEGTTAADLSVANTINCNSAVTAVKGFVLFKGFRA